MFWLSQHHRQQASGGDVVEACTGCRAELWTCSPQPTRACSHPGYGGLQQQGSRLLEEGEARHVG